MGQEVRGVHERAALRRAEDRRAATQGRAAPQGEPEGGRAGERESIGRYLARQRVLRNISVEELAQLTKVPRRSLERLEAGAFDLAPDGFVRGFVRTVAEALGLDPDETVMRLLREPDGARARAGSTAAWQRRGMRLLLAALLLLLVLGLWASLRDRGSAPEPLPEDVILRRDPVRDLVERPAAP